MRIRKYLTIMRISFQNTFVYRSQFVSGVLFYSLFIFVFLNLWRAIYQGGEVAGYNLTQMVWYLCITELIIFGGKNSAFGEMNEEVKSGSIAYQLNRPYHYVIYKFSGAIGQMMFNLIIYGSLAILLAMVMVGPIPSFDASKLPFMLLSMLLGMIINFFFMMTLGLTAFKLEENSAIFFVYNKLVFMLGMFMPVEFLPTWLGNIAKALPFSYVAWAPAKLFVAFSWEFFYSVIPIQLLWVAVSFVLAFSMYNLGMRGLQANGG